MSNSTNQPQSSQPIPSLTISRDRSGSDSSLDSTKSPRTARFVEATAVISPVNPSQSSSSKNPFRDPPTNHYAPQPQIADVGFGYMNRNSAISVEVEETDERYLAPTTPANPPPQSPLPIKSPLKSAMKTPGAPPRNLNTILSPTFQEEEALEKAQKATDIHQRRDLKSKIRVRIAKFIMRSVNFGCSLIVLSMLATTFTIFNATKSIPPRNALPPWASGTVIWPQITLICIACVSLTLCVAIFYGYWKGGHKRAEKVDLYYTTFTVAFFVFSIVMWLVGAIVLNQARNTNGGTDLWGWSCKENNRKELFQDEINYSLICQLQNWSLICAIIEIVVEVITIIIYGITFYRYYSKRRLRKTMAMRDRARSDLYLAQLKLQSAPNTPGMPGMLSPRDGGWIPPTPGLPDTYGQARAMEDGEGTFASLNEKATAAMDPDAITNTNANAGRFITIPRSKIAAPKAAFHLQAAPLSKAARAARTDSSPASPVSDDQGDAAEAAVVPSERLNDHVPAAPGEAQYGAVAIPGAYAAPATPGFAPR